MDLREFTSKGGKARWKGIDKKQRSETMRKVALSKKKKKNDK